MAFDFKQALSGIAERAKKAYYFFEDKYYSLLDIIDEKISVYRIIDPVDNFVPTFVLFIAAFIVLFVGLFFLLGQQGVFAANVQVFDADGLPIASQQVSISFDGNTADYLTDDNGSFLVNLKQKEQIATILVEAEGFEKFEEEILLVAGNNALNSISLKKAGPIMFSGPFNIAVVDSSGQRITDTEVTVRFACSLSVDSAPEPITNSKGFFIVSLPKGCGDLFASFVAAGYEPKNNARISRESEEVELARLDSSDSKGKINVIVKDASNNAVAGALVALFDGEGIKLQEDSSDASGMLVFENLEPATYELSVSTEDGRQGKKTVFVVEGRESTITITLPNATETGKKILLKVVDANTNEPLNNVTASFFDNNSFFKSAKSDVRGIISVNVALENEAKSFSAVLTHPSYILKIAKGLVVSSVAIKDAQVIPLDKIAADCSNYASLKVFVLNEQDAPVPNALVSLFFEGFENPLFENPKIADDNGSVFFSNLPPGSFRAYAQKQGFDEDFSLVAQLFGGSTATAIVRLVLGRGAFNAHVSDLQGKPVQDASVQFFELVTNALLDSGKTNASGNYLSKSFKANKNVYLHITATGFLPQTIFLPQTTNPFSVIKDINRDVNVALYRVIEIDQNKKISFRFVGLFKEDKTPVAILQPNQSYLAKFNMILPSDSDYSNVVMHVRAGLDSQASAGASDAVLKNVAAPLLPDIVLSRDFNPANPFSNQNPVESDSNAKQANVSWQRLDKGVFEIIARIFVKPNLATDTPVELHYLAKSSIDGTIVSSDDFVQRFKVGQNVCLQNCPAFDWVFEMQRDGEAEKYSLEQSKKFALSIESDYWLFYKIYNLGGTGFSSSGLTAKLSGNSILYFKDAATQTTLLAFSSIAIPEHSEIVFGMQSPIKLHSSMEAAFVDLNLALSTTPEISVSDNSKNAKLLFSVLAGNELLVEIPQSIPQNALDFTIKVKDKKTGAAINNAFAWVLPDVDLSVSTIGARQATKDPSRDAEYVAFFEPGFAPKDFVSVKVSAPNYRTFYGKAMVTGEFFDYPSNFDYSCLTIDANPNTFELEDIITIERPKTAPRQIQVMVSANRCEYDSVVSISAPFYLGGSIGSSAEQAIGKTESKTFTITIQPNVPQGKIPLYLAAKFSDDAFRRRLKSAFLIVTDFLSCFSMVSSASLADASTIIETSQSDFEAGTLDKIDALSVPGEISILLEEGSRITSLENGWFAVPGTDKVFVFQYNNPNTKVFNTPGVMPQSGIAGLAGYFGIVADDIVFSSKFSDAGPEPKIKHNAAGTKITSKVVPMLSGTTVYFATVVDGNRAYVWQSDSVNFDILVLGGVDSKSTIASGSTYFSVAGDNNFFSWDFRHITNETAYPLRIYNTPGTKQSSRIAFSTTYFAVVGDSGKLYIWNAANGNLVARDMNGVSASSKIIPSETKGYFFVTGTDSVFSIRTDGSSQARFSTPGILPESNIVSADYYFVVVGTDTTYSGYKTGIGAGSGTYHPKTYATTGTVPNSTVRVNAVSSTKDYFSVIAKDKIFAARFGYSPIDAAHGMKTYSVPGISPLSPIETPLITGGDAYFFTAGTDHSFLWKNNSPPIDLATSGTAYFSTIGFDDSSSTFIVSSKDNVFLINEMAYSEIAKYPVKSIALSGASYRSKTIGYNGSFIVTGAAKMYSITYNFSTKSLSKTEFNNVSGIDIPKYAPLATYATKNYFSFGANPSATIIRISWLENKPLQTGLSAQYSFDNGQNWSNVASGEYLYRTAEQLKLRFLLFTSSELVTPSIQELTIKYTPKTDVLTQNKFVFEINHDMDSAAVQNKCYGFVEDRQLPALNVIAGIEPSAIILRYEPMPKSPSAKLTELYQFPDSCSESTAGDIVECNATSVNAEDTFVSEVNIPDCNKYSSAANYKLKSPGDSQYLLDAKQRIILAQDVNGIEQDCFDYVSSNYILFKFKSSFLYSLPAEQKKARLQFYSDNAPTISHNVFLPSSGWSESTVWETMPAIGNSIGQLSYLGNHWWELDITEIYKEWKENPETNNGLYIISNGNLPVLYNDNFPSASFGAFSFNSSNNPNASKRPKIVFGYESEPDKDTRGMLDFNVSNNSLIGEENYALLDYNDYVWATNGKLVTGTDKFHVQLRASQQQDCAMPNNVFGKTGNGALPNLLFSWQWKNIPINACDQNTQNYAYCDSTQFSIELLKKINEIRQLALQPGKREEIAKYLHFNAYLIKDGYGTDFRKDFDYYMRNVTTYNTEQFYKDTMFGLFKYFGDESYWEFISSGFNNQSERVLTRPGLYQIDLGFDFEGEQFVFFNGTNPSAKITITMTFLKDPATPNPLYELPFDGEIGFTKRPDETTASRQNYGLAYSGEQNVYIVDAPGEEIVKTNNVSSPNPANTLAVSKNASIQALNSFDLRGGLLLIKLSDKSLNFLQTNATPLVMEIDSVDANARGFYKIEQLTNPATNETQPISFSDYGNVWTGIFSTMSCFDFAGKKQFLPLHPMC